MPVPVIYLNAGGVTKVVSIGWRRGCGFVWPCVEMFLIWLTDVENSTFWDHVIFIVRWKLELFCSEEKNKLEYREELPIYIPLPQSGQFLL